MSHAGRLAEVADVLLLHRLRAASRPVVDNGSEDLLPSPVQPREAEGWPAVLACDRIFLR